MSEVFFRNYTKDKTWEISVSKTSIYIPYEFIESDTAEEDLKIVLSVFDFPDLKDIVNTLIKYTKDPQEDMFVVVV